MPRGPKVAIKEYHVPNSSQWSNDGFTLRKITTGSGRAQSDEWLKRVSEDLYLDGSVDNAIKSIQHAAKNLTDARVDSDYYYDYDGERSHRTCVIGWSTEVSEAEIIKATETESEEERKREERKRVDAERALANIRANFPDLLN